MESFDGKKPVVLVTGASRGIGLAVVKILLNELNSRVIALSRTSNDALLALAADHPSSLAVVLGDITDPITSKEAVKTASEQFGQLDGIILNAGVLSPAGPVASATVESPPGSESDSWKSLFDVNFFSLIYTIQESLPKLRSSSAGGKIIMVSSGAAQKSYYGWGAYSASKAAMNSLARTLATEEKDITTVALRPGAVDTDMQATVRSSGDKMHPTDLKSFTDMHGNGKLVNPDDVGYVIASLSLSAPKALSGQFVSWDSEDCREHRRRVSG